MAGDSVALKNRKDKKDLNHITVFEQRAEGGMGARPDASLRGRVFQKVRTIRAKALRWKAGQREQR